MLFTVTRALLYLLVLIECAILIRSFMSFLPLSKANPLVRIVHIITEPILGPIRNMLDKTGFMKNAMFDLSPLVALLLIMLLINILF